MSRLGTVGMEHYKIAKSFKKTFQSYIIIYNNRPLQTILVTLRLNKLGENEKKDCCGSAPNFILK